METRRLGHTELDLSVVGLGTWAMGGGDWAYGWGPQADEESIAAIHKALDLGINWIDTAAVYGLGHAESVVARALEGLSQDVIVATKCGLVWDEGKTTPYGCLDADSVRRECENSLRRLGRDAIDLYQIHWPMPPDKIEEAWGVLGELKKEGKIRYAGVSNFDVTQMERAGALHPVASLQPPYSMLRRKVEDAFEYCREQGIGIVAYSPMQAGLLTGAITKERMANLPPEDWRNKTAEFKEPQLSANLRLVEGLKDLASRRDATPAQVAIAWVLRAPEVTSAIVGARRPSQIEETVVGGEWSLSQDELAEIDELLAEREKSSS
jgi:aryl-alcohol dehydrogenase-like predicted oxidoreductase